ncbi:unnamed protein product [Adineta ricciae]|uniref:Uncharacterized protein n=1 Tax=Adineta ricciae TaxID=249248 RepID=A0A814I970_ADIRI|nr:unnamed protein product [Adineta ricciae]
MRVSLDERYFIYIQCITLIIRVIYTCYRIQQRIQWRNYKKMASQLIPISIIYIILDLPVIIMYTLYVSGLVPSTIRSSYYNDSLFFLYWIILFTPFATVFSLPDF